MQRSIINKTYIKYFYICLLFIYEVIAPIYWYLPPMVGVLFILLVQSFKNNDTYYMFAVLLIILIFEANYNIFPFVTIIIFTILHYSISSRLEAVIICNKCVLFIHIILAYIFLYLGLFLISFIFNSEYLNFNFILILHIIIEMIIVALFLG
jgi:hypothetical protein